MPHIVITRKALRDLEICRNFLITKNQLAAQRAIETIKRRIDLLMTMPDIGRPSPKHHGRRELTIEFGDSGYVALYRFEPNVDIVYVLAFRHQKEAGY